MIMNQRMTSKCVETIRDAVEEILVSEKKRGNGRSAGKIDDRQTEVRLASQLLVSSNNLAVATIKRPPVVSVVPVSGRNFRTKSRKEGGGKKKERETKETRPKRQSPGARDTLTTGQVLIAVAAASSFLETTPSTSVINTFANTRRYCGGVEGKKNS